SSDLHVIAEMTYAEPGQMHLSRVDILQLMKAHPGVRFMLTHRGTDQAVDGAVLARDCLTLRLPLSSPAAPHCLRRRPAPRGPGSCAGPHARTAGALRTRPASVPRPA